MPNVGIVGLGKMGILHAGIINELPNCKVTAICESEPLIARVAKKIIQGVSYYKHVSEMVEDGTVDTVFITTPIHTHAPIIRSIFESNRKICLFSEKPLAAYGRDAHEVAEAAAARGLTNMVGFQKRFSPILQYAKQVLDGRAIGELRSFKCYSYTSDIFSVGTGWRFRRGTGGALLDLGPHLLEILLWYFGEPKSVSATKRSIYSSEVEDEVHANLTFQSDLEGKIDISWSQRGYRLPEIHIEVQGSNGSIIVSDDYVTVQVDQAVNGVQAGRQVFQKPAFNTSVDFQLADPEYTIEDKFFLQAVTDGRHVEPNFQTAAKVNDLVDLIHETAEVE